MKATPSLFTVINPSSANPTKWSNTLKQFVGKLPTNCLSVFDHFVNYKLQIRLYSAGKTENWMAPPSLGVFHTVIYFMDTTFSLVLFLQRFSIKVNIKWFQTIPLSKSSSEATESTFLISLFITKITVRVVRYLYLSLTLIHIHSLPTIY